MIKADYIDHLGSDITVVNSARVSFNKETSLASDGSVTDKDKKLIAYLAKHHHFTPFTHPQITLRETVPIFVARQRFKHVVGFTYNETSRRYVDDTPELYAPEFWRNRPEGSIKQGSGDHHPQSAYFKQKYLAQMNQVLDLYEEMIAGGVAPEQARMILPQSMVTSYYVTGSLAAYARLYNQRSDSHAQKEIQELAEQIDQIISKLYPVSWKALTQGDY